MKPKFIDSDKEYIQALYELNQLDDDDDWELYKQQERNHIENDIDVETYLKYVTIPGSISQKLA
jgi:hypothetical protein